MPPSTPEAAIEAALAAAQSPACRHAFLQTTPDGARAQVRTAIDKKLPLAGWTVSVKDLFDVQGQVTRAGSVVLDDAPPATRDSTAVARLRAAGASLVGRTNMSEFAFSGVGVNPHYGTPANVVATDVPRIPGGSSSGAAVSVAAGAARIGLGSDTGGSIRIPAALQGLVGFKNTARLVPTDGALPLSTTLDTVCAMTRDMPDAIFAHEILAARQVDRTGKALKDCRFAVPKALMLDAINETVARAFERTLQLLATAGAQIEDISLAELNDLAAINATGGFSAAESYAWHRELLAAHGAQYDPRVKLRMERGAGMTAWQYIDLQNARRDWIARTEAVIAPYDALLSPTVPIVAPPIAEVAPGPENDEAFFRVNALLLRNPAVVNMLDGCAVTLPMHAPDELPSGLMLWHSALHDDALLNIALQIERLRQQQP